MITKAPTKPAVAPRKTIAYTSAPPWAKNGIKVDAAETTTDFCRAAGLDWTVSKRDLYYDAGDGTMPRPYHNQFALTRDDTGEALSIVGRAYQPSQNAAAFKFFDGFLTSKKAVLDLGGTLDHGRVVWGLANLAKTITVGKSDAVHAHLFLGNPHGQGRALCYSVVTVREVCNNTLSIAMRSGAASRTSISHAALDQAGRIASAELIMSASIHAMTEFGDRATALAAKKIRDQDAENMLIKIFSPTQTKIKRADREPRAQNKIDELLAIYRTAPGATPGNLWGVLNAATYYVDHVAGRSDDQRWTVATIGTGASKKAQALRAVTAML